MHVCSFTCTISPMHRHKPKTVLYAQNLVYEKIIIYEGLLWFLFLRPQTAVQLYILGHYCSVKIGFNINIKCHTLPIHHASLNTLSVNHYILLYSELNKVYYYFWILKWVNLHCNWINLSSILDFPKQWIANYRGVFRTLSKM